MMIPMPFLLAPPGPPPASPSSPPPPPPGVCRRTGHPSCPAVCGLLHRGLEDPWSPPLLFQGSRFPPPGSFQAMHYSRALYMIRSRRSRWRRFYQQSRSRNFNYVRTTLPWIGLRGISRPMPASRHAFVGIPWLGIHEPYTGQATNPWIEGPCEIHPTSGTSSRLSCHCRANRGSCFFKRS